jgi:hypothetical protein
MFTETKIPDAVLEVAGICQNCFIKFNEYDEHQTMANQIQIELTGMFHHRGSSSAFVDVKQEIKVENDDYYFGFEDAVVEVIDPGIYPKETFKKKPHVKRTKPVISEIRSGDKVFKQKIRTTSYMKQDKDAGLIVCMINGLKHYKCEFCGKTDFKSRSRLRTHMQIHTSERNFMCQVKLRFEMVFFDTTHKNFFFRRVARASKQLTA